MTRKTKAQVIASAKRATADGGSAYVCCEDGEYFFLFAGDLENWNLRDNEILALVSEGELEEVYA